ncbi:MAG: hypothetical protein J6Y92_02215 [Lentisphaeria bacterium]|nr:hypothetical protein [Lentisphaeria bacterium]
MKNNDRISSGEILEKKEKKGCMIVAVVLGCILTAIVAGAVWIGLELCLHADVVGTWANMGQVDKALFMYSMSHGCYPPQQDMESLLETLGLKDSDFQKVWLTDIKSAEYHAPPGAVKVPDVSQDPILTIRVRQHVFGGNQLYILRRDGSGITVNEASLTPAVGW